MKTTLTGYISPNLDTLKALDADTESPFLVHNLRTWFLPDNTLNISRLDIVDTVNGKAQAIPVSPNTDTSYGYTAITANTSETTLDFSTLPRCIELTLNINTTLELINLRKHTKYLLKINFNNYVVENLVTLVALPLDILYSAFNINNEFIILELEYITSIFSTVLFTKAAGSSVIAYVENTGTKLFDTKLHTNTVDSSSNAYSGTASGSITVSEGILLGVNRVTYPVDNQFSLNNTNFSIECFIRFLTEDAYGSIFSRWSDTSRQFWVYVDTSSILRVLINEGTSIIGLSYNLTNYLNETLDYVHILVTRTHNIYKLFVNGTLVDTRRSKTNMTISSAKVVIGALENASGAGDVGNTSFPGIIRDIQVSKYVRNNYPFRFIYPKNSFDTDVAFLIQNSLTERVANAQPSYTSTVSTAPVIGTGTRRDFSVGNYNNQIINKEHHLEYAFDSRYELTGSVTIEAWIRNTSGNTRGTIILQGDSSDTNYHFGIYDNKLRIEANNGAFTLTSTDSIADDIWTHVAFVRDGSNNRLYINGIYNGGSSSSVPLNAFGTSITTCIKRKPDQNAVEAAINTSLYPSKSLIALEGLRITKRALYSGVNTGSPNFLLPGEFSYRLV